MLKLGLVVAGAYLLSRAREEKAAGPTAYLIEGVEADGAPEGILRARFADRYQAVNLQTGRVASERETPADQRRNRRRRARRQERRRGRPRGRGPAVPPEVAEECGPAPKDGFVVSVVKRFEGGVTLCVWFKGWSLRVENAGEGSIDHIQRRLDSLTVALGRAQSLSPTEIREVLYWLAVATAVVRVMAADPTPESTQLGLAAARLLQTANAKIPQYQ